MELTLFQSFLITCPQLKIKIFQSLQINNHTLLFFLKIKKVVLKESHWSLMVFVVQQKG